jgi:hypothetical protein
VNSMYSLSVASFFFVAVKRLMRRFLTVVAR